jgi:hypothetical protein
VVNRLRRRDEGSRWSIVAGTGAGGNCEATFTASTEFRLRRNVRFRQPRGASNRIPAPGLTATTAADHDSPVLSVSRRSTRATRMPPPTSAVRRVPAGRLRYWRLRRPHLPPTFPLNIRLLSFGRSSSSAPAPSASSSSKSQPTFTVGRVPRQSNRWKMDDSRSTGRLANGRTGSPCSAVESN